MNVEVLSIDGCSVKMKAGPNVPVTLDSIKPFVRTRFNLESECTFFMNQSVVRRGCRLMPQDDKNLTITYINKAKFPEKSFPQADCAFEDHLRFTESSGAGAQSNNADIYHRYSGIRDLVDDIANQLHGQTDPDAVRLHGSLNDYIAASRFSPALGEEPQEEEDTDEVRPVAPLFSNAAVMMEETAVRFAYSEDEEIARCKRYLENLGFSEPLMLSFLTLCNGNEERVIEMCESILRAQGYVPPSSIEEEEEEEEEDFCDYDYQYRHYYY